MAVIVRILTVSLLTGVLAGVLGLAVFHPHRYSPDVLAMALLVGCVGGVIGAVAGAAREVVSAGRPKGPRWPEIG